MSKIQPIPKELWGALGLVTNHIEMALATTNAHSPKLEEACDLLREYQSCFGADGRVSQRGEIPQVWNSETIFTPHREVGNKETYYNQPLLPFEDE